jgi:hypothetical protein
MHVRSLPDTVPDYNFGLHVVEVMHVGNTRMMRKEASNVIDSCLYAMYVYLCNIYQCNLHHSTCRLLLNCSVLDSSYQCNIRRCACLSYNPSCIRGKILNVAVD